MRFLLLALAMAMSVTAPATAATIVYNFTLDGASEAPPNASPAVGTATVTFDDVMNIFRVQTSFSGLQGNVTAAHIHCCTMTPEDGTAGVATQVPSFAGFPMGVTLGSYDQTFDASLASSWRAAYIAANGGTPLSAFSALIQGAADGKAYLNIHSTAYPGGEIRGFLTSTTAVPEPSAWAMMIAGFGLTGAALRRRGSQRLATI